MPTDLLVRLTPSERSKLKAFLEATEKAMVLPEAEGFLTAIASAPTLLAMPKLWQPMVVGEPEFDTVEEAGDMLSLVPRLHQGIRTDLSEGKDVTADYQGDSDALSTWCGGYLRGTQLDSQWRDDEQGVMFLMPIGALSGHFDLRGQKDDNGKAIEDPEPQLQQFRQLLPTLVLELYQYFSDRRAELPVDGESGSVGKVGRNDPCPCGSGEKFKKCCAAPGDDADDDQRNAPN